MASLGWIFFSREHRNRIGSVLDLLKPEGMVDELGIGTIRNALADEMFPGISTIQTRARYFFIVPYILYEYQLLKPAQRKNRTPLKYLETREYEIMWKLAEQYNYEEGNGVIGITKRKPNKIARRPSTIYWNGIYTYKFIETRGLSMDAFLKKNTSATIESLLSATQQGDDESTDDADAEYENRYGLKVRPKPGWAENPTLDLRKNEAEIFRDRIISVAKNKLIAELLINEQLWQQFMADKYFMDFARNTQAVQLPDDIKKMLILAHDFSELMLGAHIAYNCQLQHKVFAGDFFDKEWDAWLEGIQTKMLDYKNFNPEVLFGFLKTTREKTKHFVREWWELTRGGFPDLKKRDVIIQAQEERVKGNKARLRWNKTDDVKEKTWIGLKHLSYRYSNASTILKDIKTGLLNDYATPEE